jgi:lipopolysaccharide transport system permease protein
MQLWMFLSPVIYPASMVRGKYHWLLALNPMGGVIQAYRASILGHLPIDWFLLGVSTAMIFMILIFGLYYFRRMERVFADVI